MTSQHIIVKGCRQHNLKGVSLTIPKHSIVVMTGVSGSGKSSLAFDTLYAESQRRFLEYLSPKVRHWIKQMPRPEVDLIEGLSPSLAIDQHRRALSNQGTVATHTDLYDFLCLLFARVGQQHSPVTGKLLSRQSRQQITESLLADYPEGSRLQLIAPINLSHESLSDAIQRLQKMGFVRLLVDGQEIEEGAWAMATGTRLEVVVDRIQIREGIRDRLGSSVETALNLGQGILKIQEGTAGEIRHYTEVFLCPDSSYAFAPLTPADFNFNSPHGACPACGGKGCDVCHGQRLKPTALACRIKGKNISELCALRVEQLIIEAASWDFPAAQKAIADEIVPEISSRLRFLCDVGLPYLELDRPGGTLSEGEAQRVQLASLIGAKLSGVLYVLDEPSRGLHRQDIEPLALVIRRLTQLGNSVILVEHDKTLIRSADQMIELGPGAGQHGGDILFQGTVDEMMDHGRSPTAQWLRGDIRPHERERRLPTAQLQVINASLHNLKKLNVTIPLGVLVGIYGVSGSGKSTLALDVIAPEIHAWLTHGTPCPHLSGYETIERLSVVEQSVTGAMARSNPASYIDIMPLLRDLFAKTRLARARGYTAARFSLNRPGGRCEACQGLGLMRVDMGFMPDIYVPCDVCHGQRYDYETLQVLWEGRSFADVLALTAEQALPQFHAFPEIARRLQLMVDLGLDYLTLGQSFTTLSGGEMQRLKLISELGRKASRPTLFVMDEPCVGLHYRDVAKLALILHRLVDAGHSVLVVDHNLDLLAECDWVVEMGPTGGPKGGKVVFEGTPDALIKAKTATGRCFKQDRHLTR